MDAPVKFEKPSAQPAPQSPEGCLVVAIRVPVRIVVLVLVVPVRVVWDALVVGGRFLWRTVLRPVGRALFVWPSVALWRYVVVPGAKAVGRLAKVLVAVPLVWLYRHVLTPVGHALAWTARGIGSGLAWVYARVLTPVGHACVWVVDGVTAVVAWLGRYLLVVPAGWLYAWVLAPVGRAIAWCGRGLLWLAKAVGTGVGVVLYWTARILLVLPAIALWRWVLAPVGRVLAVVGREVWDALGHAWRIAGHISVAVGRALATLFRWIFVAPVSWVYRTVLTPVGHVVRDLVLRPAAEAARAVGRVTRQALTAARESARQARADFRRMVFGEPRQPQPVERREPMGDETRTLGRSTTVLTKD
ncbi:hypothetical protein SAMN05216489_03668 [Streptomyces sp. 3213]|uniref:hypothetical protein n=1 Tax=Streptomyces sp. 3213.3 TaxID=1855348 RepID=UPI00089818F0|nr:hypothetical protein [Streptomyces sp. 3213.3]SED52118.1 hypothetical protein SAMN05216489_03668 [Streptomyces sp. 3213] [Streptomyces sp. 3213.3]